MAREYAQNRIAMWNDDDFRNLTSDAQNLYSYLLAHPSTTYAGVVDWRPSRLQSVNRTWTAQMVEEIGAELVAGHYIVIDHDTEEAAIRSFLRWETMLKNPNLSRAVVKAFNQLQSRMLRGVIAFEVSRLHDEHPEWAAFAIEDIDEILDTEGIDAKLEAPSSGHPSGPSSAPSSGGRSDRPSDPSSDEGTVWAITSNKKQITDNKKPITLQQSTRDETAGIDDELDSICRKQLADVFKVDFLKVQFQLGKSCGRIPTSSDVVRVVAAILERAVEPPDKPTPFVVAAIKNNWAEWQKLMDEVA